MQYEILGGCGETDDLTCAKRLVQQGLYGGGITAYGRRPYNTPIDVLDGQRLMILMASVYKFSNIVSCVICHKNHLPVIHSNTAVADVRKYQTVDQALYSPLVLKERTRQ